MTVSQQGRSMFTNTTFELHWLADVYRGNSISVPRFVPGFVY